MAHLMALRSKDPSTQAGAIVVDANKIVVGLGYNGWVRGARPDEFPWEREGSFLETKYAYVVHAEENAIYNANQSTRGCVLYCSLFPVTNAPKRLFKMASPK
jgi:dCMP deaminase